MKKYFIIFSILISTFLFGQKHSDTTIFQNGIKILNHSSYPTYPSIGELWMLNDTLRQWTGTTWLKFGTTGGETTLQNGLMYWNNSGHNYIPYPSNTIAGTISGSSVVPSSTDSNRTVVGIWNASFMNSYYGFYAYDGGSYFGQMNQNSFEIANHSSGLSYTLLSPLSPKNNYKFATVSTVSVTDTIIKALNGSALSWYTKGNGTINYSGNRHSYFNSNTLIDKSYGDSIYQAKLSIPIAFSSSATAVGLTISMSGSSATAIEGSTTGSGAYAIAGLDTYTGNTSIAVYGQSNKGVSGFFSNSTGNISDILDCDYASNNIHRFQKNNYIFNTGGTGNFNFSFTSSTKKPLITITSSSGKNTFVIDSLGVTLKGTLPHIWGLVQDTSKTITIGVQYSVGSSYVGNATIPIGNTYTLPMSSSWTGEAVGCSALNSIITLNYAGHYFFNADIEYTGTINNVYLLGLYNTTQGKMCGKYVKMLCVSNSLNQQSHISGYFFANANDQLNFAVGNTTATNNLVLKGFFYHIEYDHELSFTP